jgi:hypothetical protein
LHKYVYSDIVTLQKENEICCITETTDYPIYIDPPAKMINNKPVKFLMQDNWNNDNWLLKDVSNSNNGAVIDKRWEDFQIVKTSYQRFTSVTSLSFSVYSPFEIEFFTNDDENLDYFKWNRGDQKWLSFTILLQNNSVFYLENDEVIRTTTDFKPHEIVVKTKNQTFWKIHKYQFMWSDTAADVKPTTVAFPSIEKSCLMFYVSLCKTCILKIPKLNHTYKSTDLAREYVVQSWQSHQLNLELKERALTFFKGKTDNDTKGYWGIDIRECPETVDDKVIYRTQIIDKKPLNRTCQIMLDVDKRTKRHPAKEQKEIFKCKVGKLRSPHCDVSCETVLGSSYKFCEEHRICENSNCGCAWGYTGLQCNTPCESGKWGLSCEKLCQPDCEKYDKVTGICRTDYPLYLVAVGSVVLVLVLSLTIVSITSHNLIKCWKPRYQGVSTGNTEMNELNLNK